MSEHIEKVFGKGGALAARFEHYQPRVGQVEMALVVDETMELGGNLLVEAPTGTGKSVAYGVPASYYASKGQKVCIVTANIALQEQLVEKDLPLIKAVVPWKFEYALAKGIGNYLCLENYDNAMLEVVAEGFKGTPRDSEQWDKASKWANTTKTGDTSELDFEMSHVVRLKMTTTADDCMGKKCPRYTDCHAMRAKSAYKSATVVVTNYSMFFIDMALKAKGGDGVLPKFVHIVLDEGHKIADIARSHIGWNISTYGLANAAKLLNHEQSASAKRGWLPVLDAELKERLIRNADEVFSSLRLLKESEYYETRFRLPWDGKLYEYAQALCDDLDAAATVYGEATQLPGITDERSMELASLARRCSEHSQAIGNASNCTDITDWVFYLDETSAGTLQLCGSPIDIAPWMQDNLFELRETEDSVRPKSVTITSATLATKFDDFDYISKEIGVVDPQTLTVENPFDVERNMMVVVPPMADPTSPKFIKQVATRIQEATDLSRGRALCLFTSYRVMDAVYKLVAPGFPYRLLKQGDAPRTRLIEQFRRDVDSVLFGTESFWAGVDVPGESCSLVVVDKLPFPNIGDPVQDALKKKMGRDYFDTVSIPVATIALRQGVGRLLRTATDRGVVLLLDSRVTDKGYGKKFLRAFPPGVRVERDINEVGRFLASTT